MAKKFTQFVQEAHIKSINEEELTDFINEIVEKHDLTEEETQEVLDELFGIGSAMKRVAGAVASPFKHVGAWVKGKVDKAKSAIHSVRVKSRAADIKSASKLAAARQTRAASQADTYKKAAGADSLRSKARQVRQANIRTRKAGGGVTSTGSAYITHPETGRHVSISKDDAAAIGRGEKTASDIVKAKASKPKAAAPAPKPKAKAPSSVVKAPRRR